VRALSLTQPWATLVVLGEKRIETRSWRTPHRGRLGIHAAKGFPRWARERCSEQPFIGCLYRAGYRDWADLPLGAILGWVDLVDCVPTTGIEVAGISHQERAFGDYSEGRWAWLLDEPRAFALPRPHAGALGVWSVKEAALA
jgi:activating signal cointegrator 1